MILKWLRKLWRKDLKATGVTTSRFPSTSKTPEEVIQIGTYCRALMTDETFNALFHEFEVQNVQQMLLTSLNDTQTREALYAQTTGAREFLGLLHAYVQAAEQLTTVDESPEDSIDGE